MPLVERLVDRLSINLPTTTLVAHAIGDLMYYDSSAKTQRKASTRADTGSLAGNQADFAPVFTGVAADQRLASESSTGVDSNRSIRAEGIFDCPCASATWEIGDLVGIDRDSGNSLNYNSQVIKVTDPSLAIGQCLARGTSITTVRAWLSAYDFGWFKLLGTQTILTQRKVCQTALAVTSSTTLADIPNLSVSLQAGKRYIITGKLFTSGTANGGIKVGLGGTATATSIIGEVKGYTTTTSNLSAQATAIGSLGGATVANDSAIFSVEILTNAAGTLTIQGAQNASHADTTTFKVGSWMVCENVP